MAIAWQYNGVAPFNTLFEWCKNTLGSAQTPGRSHMNWYCKNETIYFFDEEDYTMFVLRWGG